MSAESGIATFRDGDGLWARYRIEDVCTPEALESNRQTVIEFYNMRRRELLNAKPNDGHRAIVELARSMDVEVVTQNIDDLHERAAAEMGGVLHVTHLHGELRKLRSSRDPEATVTVDGWEQRPDARHPDGSLLRPHVVFFGESVPMFDRAARIVAGADTLIVVGTSLAVYPAASLVSYARSDATIYLIDPKVPDGHLRGNVIHIRSTAARGLPELAEQIKTA
jgi:NAD-dependent deacetylase